MYQNRLALVPVPKLISVVVMDGTSNHSNTVGILFFFGIQSLSNSLLVGTRIRCILLFYFLIADRRCGTDLSFPKSYIQSYKCDDESYNTQLCHEYLFPLATGGNMLW